MDYFIFDLDDNYKAICGNKDPVAGKPFGDDLQFQCAFSPQPLAKPTATTKPTKPREKTRKEAIS